MPITIVIDVLQFFENSGTMLTVIAICENEKKLILINILPSVKIVFYVHSVGFSIQYCAVQSFTKFPKVNMRICMISVFSLLMFQILKLGHQLRLNRAELSFVCRYVVYIGLVLRQILLRYTILHFDILGYNISIWVYVIQALHRKLLCFS